MLPALVGRFLTARPPGKASHCMFWSLLIWKFPSLSAKHGCKSPSANSLGCIYLATKCPFRESASLSQALSVFSIQKKRENKTKSLFLSSFLRKLLPTQVTPAFLPIIWQNHNYTKYKNLLILPWGTQIPAHPFQGGKKKVISFIQVFLQSSKNTTTEFLNILPHEI